MRAVEYPVSLTVSFSMGSYTTQTVAGKRASSTSSAESAAERLAAKLLPAPIAYTVTEVMPPYSRRVAGITLWQIAKGAR